MKNRVELVAGGVRIAIAGDTDRGTLIAQACRLYNTGQDRQRHMPHDELALEMIAVAEALTTYLYGPAARQALDAGVDGLDIIAFHERVETAVASDPEGGGYQFRWRATPEQEAELASLIEQDEARGNSKGLGALFGFCKRGK